MTIGRTIAIFSLVPMLTLGAIDAKATTTIDVSAASAAGTSTFLEAGNYSFSFIGTGRGGAYDAWNPWSDVAGCDAQGSNCTRGWFQRVALDFGNGQAALYFGSDQPRYETAAGANAAGLSSIYTFSLADARNVNFFVPDSTYGDNSGGVSLAVTNLSSAVPEPATWAMLLVGFGAVANVMRRNRNGRFARVLVAH